MITYYRYDAQGIYTENVDRTEFQPIPKPCTTVAPPSTSGTQVAQWSGSAWVVLGERPAPPPPPAITAEQINAERDRRLQADFEFQGVKYQRDTVSLQRITGAASLAGFAIAQGAEVGDLRWANPERDFVWIASDNSLNPMDAQTCFAFGQAAATVETSIIFTARMLREMEEIPQDYTDDKWWP
jgi:hypothetical protein